MKTNKYSYWVSILYKDSSPWLCNHTSPYLSLKEAEETISKIVETQRDKNNILMSWITKYNPDNDKKTIVKLNCYVNTLAMHDNIKLI